MIWIPSSASIQSGWLVGLLRKTCVRCLCAFLTVESEIADRPTESAAIPSTGRVEWYGCVPLGRDGHERSPPRRGGARFCDRREIRRGQVLCTNFVYELLCTGELESISYTRFFLLEAETPSLVPKLEKGCGDCSVTAKATCSTRFVFLDIIAFKTSMLRHSLKSVQYGV